MSGCERGWHSYPFYSYPPQHQPQWSYYPNYCSVQQPTCTNTQQPNYTGHNDPSNVVGSVIPSCSPYHWNGDELVDAFGRVVKRRSSANKKERRRTQSINNAFAELRDCIPNVPGDTKLSKIKTLRLATAYIAHLMRILTADIEDQPPQEFKAELPPKSATTRSTSDKDESSSDVEGETSLSSAESPPASTPQAPPTVTNTSTTSSSTASTVTSSSNSSSSSSASPSPSTISPSVRRTGWPQSVWAQELNF